MQSPVPVERSHLHYLTATASGHEYELQVQLPRNYEESEDHLPVLYLLDGNWYFGMATSVIDLMTLSEQVRELRSAIIVGITYRDKSVANVMALRARDMTSSVNLELIQQSRQYFPFNVIDDHSGHADPFISFLCDDLFPFIDSTYRTDPTLRIGYGHSFGGVFLLYTLFTQPGTFHKYMISSPSIWWDDKEVLKHEATYAEAHDDLVAGIYLSSGSEEHVILEGVAQIMPILKGREYAGLDVHYEVLSSSTMSD